MRHPTTEVEFAKWMNVCWLSVLFSIFAATLLVPFFFWLSPDMTDLLLNEYHASLLLFAVSAVIECLAEPLYLYATMKMMLSLRVRAEMFGNLSRCLICAISVLCFEYQLFAFAFGQVAFSLIYCGTYYFWLYQILAQDMMEKNSNFQRPTLRLSLFFPTWYMPVSPSLSQSQSLANEQGDQNGRDPVHLEPKQKIFILDKYFDRSFLKLSVTFTLQSLEKLVLTEGEKMVLLCLKPLTPEDQGILSMVQNLGSLVLRLVFQPIEEAAAAQFSFLSSNLSLQSLRWGVREGHISVAPRRLENEDISNLSNESNPANRPRYGDFVSMFSLLGTLLRVVSMFSLFLATFAPGNGFLLISLLYGKDVALSGAPLSLTIFSFTLYLFGLNGIFEAFFYSTAPLPFLQAMNRVMVFVSILYLTLCALFSFLGGLGANSFLLANAVAMSMRIFITLSYSYQFSNLDRPLWLLVLLKPFEVLCKWPTLYFSRKTNLNAFQVVDGDKNIGQFGDVRFPAIPFSFSLSLSSLSVFSACSTVSYLSSHCFLMNSEWYKSSPFIYLYQYLKVDASSPLLTLIFRNGMIIHVFIQLCLIVWCICHLYQTEKKTLQEVRTVFRSKNIKTN